MGVAEAKADLRRRMSALRDAIPPDERRRRGERIADLLLAWPPATRGDRVFVFHSFGSEVPTGGILRRLAAEGKDLYLPILEAGELQAARYRPGDPLVPSGYGALEPVERDPAPPEEIDVVIAPGLAFSRQGHRLGYGAGHYDGFFRRAGGGPQRIGIAFAAQILPGVPHDDRDERLHAIVTEDEAVVCDPGRRADGSGGA